MVVIILTDTPPKVRGDLSKWLLEVNTGVYVGNVSARVRDKLWERVCNNLKNGRATMVFTSSNEQKMDFRIHNSAWEPVDFEGLKLIRHPNIGSNYDKEDNLTKKGFSKAAQRERSKKMTNVKRSKSVTNSEYVVIDLETTGLSYQKDCIVETAALRVVDGEVVEKFSKLVQIGRDLPESIIHLTGITNQMIAAEGEQINKVLEEFCEFIQADVIVGYNTSFDLNFLQIACRSLNIAMDWDFKMVDILQIAKRKIKGLPNYRLNTLGEYFNLDAFEAHRALQDCCLEYEVYEQLNKINR